MARKMKDSGIEWIGEIPEGWEVVPVKRLCTMQAGKNLTSEQIAPEGTYPVYGGNGIRGFFSDYNCDGQFLTVGRQGALCGNVHKINGKVWATEHAVITTPSSYTILDFLYYLLIGMDLNQYVSSTAAQPGLAVGTLLNLKTCYPCSTLEQTQISNYLNAKCSEIDIMLTKTRSSIEEYKKLKQAVITQAVTTLNCPNVKLKYLMDIIVDCPHETPIYTFTGNYLVIRTSDQSLASLRCDEYMYRLDEAEYKKRTRRLTLDKDDIVYGREGSWGLACLVPQSNKYCLGQRVMQFRCNTRLLYPKYAMYALNSETVYMQGALDTIGSTAPHVNISTICNYLLPVPALTEQKEITNYLDAKCAEIDMLIAKKEQLVKELESYKKSLIYEVVTGKREV